LRLIIISTFVALLVGCSSMPNGPQFSGVASQSDANHSTLYIYRPDAYYGKAITVPVMLNDKKIADLGNEGYFTLAVAPGNYLILPDTDSIDHEFRFEAKAGQIHFLRLKVNRKPALCFCTSLEFEIADEVKAMEELAKTRLETDRFYGFK